jgi:subtilisin family serine protease
MLAFSMSNMRDDQVVSPRVGIAIGVIDSGVHAEHPHISGVAGGVAVGPAGEISGDYVDRIGHGTAVMAAIKERAPTARYYAIRVFDARLTTTASTLVTAINWAIDQRVDLINLSLGTANPAHRAALQAAVDRARSQRIAIVSASDEDGSWLPGSLPGVVAVQVDWDCPRDRFRVVQRGNSFVFHASGFARPIPGLDPHRNLNGVSFAVANVSGFLADALSLRTERTVDPAALLVDVAAQGTMAPHGQSAGKPSISRDVCASGVEMNEHAR